MSGDDFKNIVNYYGEDNILGVGFDNSGAVTFDKGQFSLANCYIDHLQALQFVNFDSKGLPYHIIKTLDGVQTIMVRDSQVNFSDYDRVTLRP